METMISTHYNTQLDGLLVAIIDELIAAEDQYPNWPTNLVEQAAIVIEEAGELLQAANNIHHSQKDSTAHDLRREAVQTAAMAIRFALNIDNQKEEIPY